MTETERIRRLYPPVTQRQWLDVEMSIATLLLGMFEGQDAATNARISSLLQV